LASAAGILLIFGALLFALANGDHRKDRNVPGATTPAGQNALAQAPGGPRQVRLERLVETVARQPAQVPPPAAEAIPA
jgi:hypothetical protein